jgi:putative flavoprotein involved in K+ transport
MEATTRRRPSVGYVEEGQALADIMGAGDRAKVTSGGRCHDVIVIGGGQAGLSVGHYLRHTGLRFVILDESERVGDAWRHRWDSLRLFTPAKFDGLPGLPFPADGDYFPTKNEMGDYLEAYAGHFGLPARSGTRVSRLHRRADGRYVVTTATDELSADQVVVAMSGYQKPRTPGFADALSDRIVQLHSSAYRGPSQLREGPVLVVGAGNSGAEIAKELSSRHRVFVSGPDVGEIPFEVSGFWCRLVLARLVLRVVFHRVFTIRTWLGKKLYPKVSVGSGPLIRVKAKHLARLGVVRVGRTVGASEGLPRLDDGRALEVDNVIWCTGYHPGFAWIDLPVIGDGGKPRHEGGVVPDAPGLYFVGLHFLYSMSSGMVHGVGRDAARIVDHIVNHRANHTVDDTAASRPSRP